MVLVSGGSWPSDKGGRHPDPVIGGGGSGLQKFFFSTLRASVWSKNKGDPGPPVPSPGSVTTGKESYNWLFLDNKRVSTLGAWALVPGYRHKMVLCSHLDYLIVYIICFILPEFSSVVSIYIWMQERKAFLHPSERNAFPRVPSRVPEGWSWWTKGRDSHHPSRSWPCSSRKYWYRLFTDPYFFS